MCLCRLWICGLVQLCPRIEEMMVGRGVVALWLLIASLSRGLVPPSLPLVCALLTHLLTVNYREFELRFEFRMNIIVALPTLEGCKCFYNIVKEALRVRLLHLVHEGHDKFQPKCCCLFSRQHKCHGVRSFIRKAVKLFRGPHFALRFRIWCDLGQGLGGSIIQPRRSASTFEATYLKREQKDYHGKYGRSPNPAARCS